MPLDLQVPFQLPVQIGSHQYFIDPAKYARRDLPGLRPQVDQALQPGEQTLNAEGSWIRSQTDWTLGGQQEIFDDETASPRRYYRQKDVQAVRRGRLQLSNRLQSRSTTRGGCDFALTDWWNERRMIQTWQSIFWWEYDGATIDVYRASIANGPYSSISPTAVLNNLVNGICFASDGVNTTWLSTGADVYRATTETGAWSVFSTDNTVMLAYCNGRLIASDATSELYELDSGGSKVTIWTHPNISWDWLGAVAAPGAIYVWGLSGAAESAVYVIDDVSPNGALQPPRIALPFPPGERVRHLEPIGGHFVARTNLGLRLVVANGDGTLSHGPLITHHDQATDYLNVPLAVSAAGDGVMCAWRHPSVQPDFISRLDLANFSGSLAPSLHPVEYTADPVEGTAANQGIGCLKVVSRSDTQYQDGQLWVLGGSTDLTVRRIWACLMNFQPNGDLNGQQKADTGYLYTGWLTYGVTEPKLLTSVVLVHDPIPAGAAIATYFVEPDGTETLLGSTVVGTTETTLAVTGVDPVRKFQLKFVLTCGTSAVNTPVLESWAARAMPIPLRQEEIILPIVLSERVTMGDDGNQVAQDAGGEAAYLRELRRDRTPVTYVEGTETLQVIVDQVGWLQGEAEKWANDRSGFHGTLMVRLLTVA